MIQDTALSETKASSIARRLDWAAGPWARTNRVYLGIAVLVMLVLPWGIIQLSIGRFILHLLILFLVWSIVAESWNLVMGVGGIFSFAQLALFAVGGIATGAPAKHLGWNPWLSLWLAPIAATIAAMIIGLPTLRLRGPYVVLLTLAFHELLRNYHSQGPKWIAEGGYGLRYVPKLGLDEMFGSDVGRIAYYYIALILFAVATYVIWRVLYSPVGMSFRALRDSETYAISRGVDPFRFKLLLFGLSAFFTGLAGGFYIHYNGNQSPAILSFSILINLLAGIVLGGWGTFWGPILGTGIMTILPEVLREVDIYRNIAIGVVLALIAIFAPQGLGPMIANGIRKLVQAIRKRQVE
ncbi:MAG: branched-chain amino acid ABC transporter permease [Anaerolineae bacterium]